MTYLAAAAVVVAAIGTAFETHAAGVAVKNEDIMKARQAGLDAGAKQIDIRQKMLTALASQNAKAGAGGIGTGGSFGANVSRQITQNQSDLLINSTNAQTQEQLYAMQGNAAEQQGNIQAGVSLLDAAGSAQVGKAINP